MHNINKANEFLIYLRDIIKENPNYPLTSRFANTVYGELIKLGIKNENDKYYSQQDDKLFKSFNDHFKDRDDIFVYPNDEMGILMANFCHFVNKKEEVHKSTEQIKIYIPLDADHLKEGATELFEYLDQENIAHISKVAKRIRFDDVVVRVATKADADKVNEFVKKNNYIQEGLIDANPFAFTNNGLVHACDGNISFNAALASYISLYLRDAAAKDELDSVNIVNFYKYVVSYYNTNLKDITDDKKLKEDFAILKPDPDDIDDYKLVSKLIINTAYPEFNYHDFIRHFEECKKTKEMKKLETYSQVSQLINQSIRIMTQKYGEEAAMENVKIFLATGDYRRLTRDKNLRATAKEVDLKERFDTMLNKNGQTVEEYWQERYGSNDHKKH